jgi:hypothetical protein
VNRINESEATAHKIARQYEADGTSGDCNEKFEHKAFLDKVDVALHYGT